MIHHATTVTVSHAVLILLQGRRLGAATGAGLITGLRRILFLSVLVSRTITKMCMIPSMTRWSWASTASQVDKPRSFVGKT